MDIDSLEEFFNTSFEVSPGSENPSDILESQFESGGLKYQLMLFLSDNRLYLNADPIEVLGKATPAIELNVQFDELEFEKYEGIEQGMMFKWKGKKQNLYISRLKDAYSISFSCNT